MAFKYTEVEVWNCIDKAAYQGQEENPLWNLYDL